MARAQTGADASGRRRWLAAAAGLLAPGWWPTGLAGAAPALGGLLPLLAPGTALARPAQPLFGTAVDLLLPQAPPRGAEPALWQALQRLHRDWNAWKPGELTALNQALAQGRGVRVAPALQAVLQQATVLEQRSGGHFNPAIGAQVAGWGFHADRLQPGPAPAAAAVAGWRAAAPSLADLHWQGAVVHSRNPAVRLDLGAYAKGVAIDQALDDLQRRGVAAALLNLGGNLAAFGQPARAPWQVGVRDPLGPGLLATLALQGREAVVTSGSYERYRLVDGEPAVHLLDPRSAAPVPARAGAPALVSVTVVHASAALADAAATALLVAGPARWPAVAERLGVRQVLVVDAAGRAQATPLLAPRLRWG